MSEDRLELGGLTVPGGFFLLRSVEEEPFHGAPDEGEFQHCFSYRDSDPTIQQAAVDMVRRARRKVFLASFRIGDRQLLDALSDAVRRLGGGVYVITAWSERGLAKGLAGLEDKATADVAAQRHRFDKMTKQGIFVRGHDQCHAKFLIVDDETALVSSANLETSALMDRPERRVTGENGVVVTDRAEVGRLARLFTRMWYSGCRWEAPPGEEYALSSREAQVAPCSPDQPEVVNHPSVIWTHDTEWLILNTIHDVIERAREELVLATFGLRGLTARPHLLHDQITAARERGVKVTLLCRARNNLPDHRDEALALHRLGVRVVGDRLTHAKGVIADQRHGALFSANLDSAHGLTSGVEVGVRLDGLPALAEAYRYFRHAIDHADLRFAAAPTQDELDRGLGAEWRRPWSKDRTIAVSASADDWRALSDAGTPVLYTTSRDGETRLHAGGGEWQLADSRLSMTVRPADPRATIDAMNGWWRSQSDGLRRGFCPATLIRSGRSGQHA